MYPTKLSTSILYQVIHFPHKHQTASRRPPLCNQVKVFSKDNPPPFHILPCTHNTAMDITVTITSALTTSERRLSPSWTLTTLKQKLYPITGIPPSSQSLTLNSQPPIPLTPSPAHGEDSTTLSSFNLQRGARIDVTDTRPPGMRLDAQSFTKALKSGGGDDDGTEEDLSDKYDMPLSEYSKRTDSVQAWKRREHLGRFDPDLTASIAAREAAHAKTAEERGIRVGVRCRVGGADERRGTVGYVGEVEEIGRKGPGNGGVWVGVAYDEPVGRNGGRVEEGGRRYFEVKEGFGAFVRPEKVEVGEEWKVLGVDESLEEL